MPDLDTAAWYALGIPLYLLFVALEVALARRRAEAVFSFAETVSNLSAGLGTLVVGLFVGPWVLRAWDFTHDHVAPFPWPAHGAWKIPAALVLADFCYYVYHRAGHRFAIFWAIHGIHHQHERLNSSVGFRLEWLADPYAALFFGLMPLAGVDSTTGFAAIAVLSFYTLTAHSPVLPRPTWGFLVTPAIHGSHHSRDARYIEKNYGAMLGVWDRLFGTWLEPAPGDALRVDLPSICRTHNGVTAQWGLVAELARVMRGRAGLGAKLRTLVERPVMVGARALRDDRDIPRAARAYVLAQFVGVTAFAAWILWFRGDRPLAVQIVGALVVVAGLYALGDLLDGGADAVRRERVRLVGTVMASAALGLYAPMAGVALAALGVGGLFALTALAPPLNAPRARGDVESAR
jgi:sterol desaturase/sphingolipid hydroxylase (fatty acid hydroxylase superfamily)